MNNDETVKWLLGRIVDELTRKEATVNDSQRVTDLLNPIVNELGEIKRAVDRIEQRIQQIDLGEVKRTIDQIEQRSRGIDLGDIKRTVDRIEQRGQQIERGFDRISSMERTLQNMETKLASIDMKVQRS